MQQGKPYSGNNTKDKIIVSLRPAKNYYPQQGQAKGHQRDLLSCKSGPDNCGNWMPAAPHWRTPAG